MERWRQFWANPAYRFAMMFLIYLGIGALLYPIASRRFFYVVEAATVLTAHLQYYFLTALGADTSVIGPIVTYGHFAVSIIEECTGVYEMVIFAAAVLAFPTTLRNRAVGVGLGLPTLYLFNVVRIFVLMIVGRYFPNFFDFMHLYFWQATLILMITSVWLAWIFWVVRRDEKTVAAPD